MTLALAGTGACHVTTGLALRPASSAGRLILMAGGAATVLVAAFPETAGDGGSLPHTFWRPFRSWLWRSGRSLPAGGPFVPAWLRPGACAVAAGVLLGLLVWFGAELIGAGLQLGLAERVLAGAEAVWPLAVVVACRWSQSRAPDAARESRRRRTRKARAASRHSVPDCRPAGTCPGRPGRRAQAWLARQARADAPGSQFVPPPETPSFRSLR